jgi:uncharacterized protein with HEPN domain
MLEKDRKFLENMLEAGRDAVRFTDGKERKDLDEDRQLTLSLLKCYEMLAAAAARVSKECRLDCKPIPWEKVIDIKHQVPHAYWDIDRDWVWNVVQNELPSIIQALESRLAS